MAFPDLPERPPIRELGPELTREELLEQIQYREALEEFARELKQWW